jgi:phage tail tube protein FII
LGKSQLNRFQTLTGQKKINQLNKLLMNASILGLFVIIASVQWSFAQTPTTAEQELINLSKQKWQWMADKNVDKLATLFHEKSKFVHMSGTWKKGEELEIIKSGSIWYKNAEVHDTAVETVDDMAIVWNRITLTAVVRGSDAVNQFTVTEVYKKEANNWKLLGLTFSSVRDTHTIKH